MDSPTVTAGTISASIIPAGTNSVLFKHPSWAGLAYPCSGPRKFRFLECIISLKRQSQHTFQAVKHCEHALWLHVAMGMICAICEWCWLNGKAVDGRGRVGPAGTNQIEP